jgi:integrase
MFAWDNHIKPMIDAAQNLRDKAAVTVAWDLGGRSGEFRSLRVGDVSDHKHRLKITVDGKTGATKLVADS